MIETLLKPGFQLSDKAERIFKLIERNDGYCPCVRAYTNKEDIKCPCKDYREQSKCKCGLYVRIAKIHPISETSFIKVI